MMMTPPRTTTTRVLALVAALACVLSCTHGAVTLQLAQSHVFPAPNRTWTLNDGYNLIDGYNDLDLHLVGARLALAIVEFGDVTNPTNPRLSITNDDVTVPIEITLRTPEHLPKTAGDENATDLMGGGLGDRGGFSLSTSHLGRHVFFFFSSGYGHLNFLRGHFHGLTILPLGHTNLAR